MHAVLTPSAALLLCAPPPPCRRNGELLAVVEGKSSPILEEDIVAITIRERFEACFHGQAFLLSLVCGCMDMKAPSYDRPIRIVIFRNPLKLQEYGLLLWHEDFYDLLCLTQDATTKEYTGLHKGIRRMRFDLGEQSRPQ